MSNVPAKKIKNKKIKKVEKTKTEIEEKQEFEDARYDNENEDTDEYEDNIDYTEDIKKLEEIEENDDIHEYNENVENTIMNDIKSQEIEETPATFIDELKNFVKKKENKEPVINFFPVLIFSSSPKLNFLINAPEHIATAAAGVDIFIIHVSISSKAFVSFPINLGVEA